MGWLRKKIKQLGRGIKKIGKKIGKAFKSVLKPFAKFFGKLGPLGSIAMMMVLPGIGQLMAGWGATFATGAGTAFGQFIGNAVKFVGNSINFVATAPQRIFQTITGGISSAWQGLTGTLPDGSTWLDTFKGNMKEAWTTGGVLDPKTGEVVGKGNFWDASEMGTQRIANIGEEGASYLGYISPDAKVTTAPTTETPSSPGAVGKIKDVTKKITDTEIPVLGTVGDIASVGSTALSTYSTAAQYGLVGSEDDPYGVGGGMTIRAEEQLYGGDQGGMYNISAPTWSYDYNQSFQQNQQNSRNVWNTAYGLPEGFDSASMGGYGFGYDQWFMEAMGFRPIR